MWLLVLAVTAAFAQPATDFQYQETILPFSEWATKLPQEKAIMGLFKNYEEPTVQFKKDKVVRKDKKTLTIYSVRMRSTVNKPAAQIKLADLIKIESIRQLDPQTKYQIITADQAMTATAKGTGQVPNFAWCNTNPSSPAFNLPNFELPLIHLQAEKFCVPNGRTICVESCYNFQGDWANTLQWLNDNLKQLGVPPEKLKDNGLAANAEVRYFTSEAEYGQNLTALTGINTPIRGVIEMRIFYSNQVFQYGKVLAIFHEHQTDAQRTVIATHVTLGIGSTTWNKKIYFPLRNAMLGKRDAKGSPIFADCPTQITSGIPSFAKCMASATSNLIEK